MTGQQHIFGRRTGWLAGLAILAAITALPQAGAQEVTDGVSKDYSGIGKAEANPAKDCVTVDFATAEIARVGDRVLLKVSGEAPHPGMSIEVRPVLYVMQPDYWLMSLVACVPAGTKAEGAPTPFMAEINIGGSVGRKGIELAGPVGKVKRIDVPG